MGFRVLGRILIAQALSSVGTSMSAVALAFMVYQLTGSVLQLGGVLAVSTFPLVVTSFIGGALLDRFSAKNVLRSESARAVISLVRKGAGVGLLFKDNIAKNLLRGEFKALKIRDARFTCPSYIIQLMDKPLSACAEKFLDLLRRSRPKENAESNRTIDLRYRQRREQTLFTGID